jgi:hypothetical protein
MPEPCNADHPPRRTRTSTRRYFGSRHWQAAAVFAHKMAAKSLPVSKRPPSRTSRKQPPKSNSLPTNRQQDVENLSTKIVTSTDESPRAGEQVMRALRSSSSPHRCARARITCEAARKPPRRSPSIQHSLGGDPGKPASCVVARAPLALHASNSTWRSRRLARSLPLPRPRRRRLRRHATYCVTIDPYPRPSSVCADSLGFAACVQVFHERVLVVGGGEGVAFFDCAGAA